MAVPGLIPSLFGHFISMKNAKNRQDVLKKTSLTYALPVKITP